MDKYYRLAVDYLYWYGALGAMREQSSMDTAPSSPLAAPPVSREASRR
jgi:hypothetical protein